MATKQRNLFLYLALACFIGIIAIFVLDGYLGVYDTLYVTAGEQEEKIEPDFWLRGGYPWTTGANEDGKVFFRYEVDNRQFSEYSANVEVSVWRMQEKVLDVLSKSIAVAPFDKTEIEWVLDIAELQPGDVPLEQAYQYSVVISQGEIERRVILYINPQPYPIKPPIPVR